MLEGNLLKLSDLFYRGFCREVQSVRSEVSPV